MTRASGKPRRRSIRLRGYDYSRPGAYFVTICTRNSEYLFGDIVDGEMVLNEAGWIARRGWQDIPVHFPHAGLDEWVIMPNHLHGIVTIQMDPARRGTACRAPTMRGRGKGYAKDVQQEFRKELVAFRNLYAFMAQVIPFQDSDLEKRYSYIRLLLTKLSRGDRGPIYNFDDEAALKFYRLQKISEGSITLNAGQQEPISGPTDVGTGTARNNQVALSTLIGIQIRAEAR